MDVSHTDRARAFLAQPGQRRIFVRDLVVASRIGAHRQERNGRQRVRINLDLLVVEDVRDLADRLENVLSYEHLVESAQALAGGPHVNLVETLAERLAEMCLADPRARTVLVRVEKLDVFIDAESVGVEILRVNEAPSPDIR